MPKLGEDGASAPVAIAVRDLRKSFGTHEVLKGVSLTAHEGDVVAIIGGSGSGKSTMLRCINFLETPTAGTIEIGGEAVKMHADGLPSDRRQLERLRQSLGMVFQSFNLWTHKTVLENLIEVPVHVMKTPAMLFDEPTSALDPELVGEVLQVIRALADEGRTMVLVTHEMKFAREVASHVIYLHNGVIEEEGPPDELFGAPKSERLKQFLKTVS